MKISRGLRPVALLSLLVVFSISSVASAQTGSGSGQLVSPVRTELTINPGSSQTITINVQNVTKDAETLQAVINDFVAGDNETGQPRLLLNPSSEAPASGLKKYIQPISNITLTAGETKPVKVTISVPANAAGGGYYAAVRFAQAKNDQLSATGASLSASVGSLILVRVPGDIKDDLRLSTLDTRSGQDASSPSSFYTSGKSIYVVARFENKGNVQEQPFGKITVSKGGKTVQTTEINTADPKSNVLPDSIRRFGVKLDKVSGFGKYTVQGNFGYGTNGQLLNGTVSFYVIPLAYIITGIVLIVLILLAVFVLPKTIRNYNKRVLRRAGRR